MAAARSEIAIAPATTNLSSIESPDTTQNSPSSSSIQWKDIPFTGAPIVYSYLTFNTELPAPTTPFPKDESYPPAPEAPDLHEYTDPFEWPRSQKSRTLWILCVISVVAVYTAGSYSSAAAKMANEWSVSQPAILVGITAFTTGFAFAPMVLAPFSEIQGRYTAFVLSGIIFFAGQIFCAETHTYRGMIAARVLAGAGASAFSTMVGGVISDIYHADDRNAPMALFTGATLLGTGLGPLCSGFIAQNLDWRWVFYVQMITCCLSILAIIFFFKETRGSVLLSRKAKALNKWYAAREDAGYFGFEMPLGNDGSKTQTQIIRWKVKSDEEKDTLAKMLHTSFCRPFNLLVTEPVVFFFSLWAAFSWAVLYLMFSSIPFVFTAVYKFTVQQNGAVFAAMCLGAILATILSIHLDSMATRYRKSPSTPEDRLRISCFAGFLLPIGLFWFGFTSSPEIPWIVPVIAIGFCTMGIFSIYLAVFNYLTDTYHRWASSALAAQSFCRNILAGIFPLVTTQMFTGLTIRGASGLLGGIALLLSLVPWVLVYHGPSIRARSRFARRTLG